MSQSLVHNLVHLIYSTKHRKPLIPEQFFDGLYAYQAGIFKQWESPAIVIGGIEDHVHALFSLSKNLALKKIVEEVKKGSSKWMKTDGPRNRGFYWQYGYAAFSVSQSNATEVTALNSTSPHEAFRRRHTTGAEMDAGEKKIFGMMMWNSYEELPRKRWTTSTGQKSGRNLLPKVSCILSHVTIPPKSPLQNRSLYQGFS